MSLGKEQLLELKNEIDDSKTKISELNGQQIALLQQLKDEWGCKTIEEAEEKLEAMNKYKKTLDKKIEKASEELEEKLNKEDVEDEEDE